MNRTDQEAHMTVTQTRYSTTDTAKLIRKALKDAFPGQKFSVRSNSYAGGSSIDVRWTDGPTAARVDEVVGGYQGADFNGMIDLKEYRDSTLLVDEDGTFEEVSYGVDFVQTHREYSEPVEAAAKAQIVDLAGADGFDYNGRYDVAVDRETGALSACGGQHVSDTYGSSILHRHLHVTAL
jgi:hypothetical protein